MSRRPLVSHHIIALLEKEHALSGPQIVTALQSDAKVNKTSVYRALEKLVEQGEICRQSFEADVVFYESRHHHHDHLVCQRCGRVFTTECLEHLPKVIDGFAVDHHHLV